MSKDSPRLSRLGVLAPAALSACMDASVLAVPAAGAIVSTVLKELSKAFMLKKWFHGIMSAKEAESLMMERGRNGSFLVRESQTHPGEYVLSVRVRGRVSHVMIRKQHDKYNVGSGEQFDDLVGLIEHFRSYPMIETSGDVLRLLQPVNGTSLRVNDIEQKAQDMSCRPKVCCKGYEKEFQKLKMLDDKHGFTTHEGSKPENVDKNRYRNILPYDQTRVVLHNDGDEEKSDYINANYIRATWMEESKKEEQSEDDTVTTVKKILQMKKPKKIQQESKIISDDALREVKCVKMDKANGNFCRDIIKDKTYIATQGCLSNTKNDFWKMICQDDVRIIVMITNEVETGRTKCERYWPLVNEEETFEDLTVQSISETVYKDYLVREFEVSDKNSCRNIYQYQFKTWPDHGVPNDTESVLKFLEDINRRMYRISQEKDAPDNNILCVHCSAGIGRTGTFIALDMLVDKIKITGFNCPIDVFNIVKVVRIQRSGMVQNKGQYLYVYEAAQDYIDTNNIKIKKKVYTSEA